MRVPGYVAQSTKSASRTATPFSSTPGSTRDADAYTLRFRMQAVDTPAFVGGPFKVAVLFVAGVGAMYTHKRLTIRLACTCEVNDRCDRG